ncbi:antA/AntB antirepressor family protein [Halomonas sp. IOP_6]|uniref:antA/AntB antirepressor family protein n=1 Tax=Halomonas sp. IOP_6 TaxID=2876583 RepID=UPI001E40DA26|nr:antA/AntB antirepressor family protein [Halomonas sp. IOP_6]MCD6005076.1 antA/AntB antirepressor family protein [Halomonas sp. IOP_6]
MSNKLTRTGRSIKVDINKLPKKTLTSSLGFNQDTASRLMRVRRMLPIVEESDRQEPQIDARKLWEKIGKPHGRFNDWAEHYIKPMMDQKNFTEKSVKTFSDEIAPFYEVTGKRGRPRADYRLSRDVAAQLAMQANTAEGCDIRQYFLDMEECVLRLERYRPIRIEHLNRIDKQIFHSAVSLAGSKSFAEETERFMKGMVAEVISGMSGSEWREALNEIPGAKGKGIRDVLDAGDIEIYRDALKSAAFLFQVGITDREQIKDKVRQVFAEKVDPGKYLSEDLKEIA